MKIVADENIPYVQEAFGSFGEVIRCPGRSLSAPALAEADVLLVRSVTRVGAALLDGSPVRFVGTATIGTDHIDQEYLQRRGITFVSAAGSNANSVAEYVMTALLILADSYDLELDGKTLGIIGVGNVGSKVEAKAPALGLQVLPNDPPLERQTHDPRFVSLAEVLAQADIITCHVPLTPTGPDATWHLLNEARLERLRPGTILLNTARGAVVDNQALKRQLHKGALGPCVLDVWENEPDIDVELLEQVSLATPHIAGYSFDGKVNGTVMLQNALCRFLQQGRPLTAADLLPDPPTPRITLDTQALSDTQALRHALTTIYDLDRDDRQLHGLARLSREQRPAFFDQLRKNYPIRREAGNTRVILEPPKDPLAEKLRRIGFRI